MYRLRFSGIERSRAGGKGQVVLNNIDNGAKSIVSIVIVVECDG